MDWFVSFGNTGFNVSRLGFGGGQIGGADLDDAAAGRFLNAVLDSGVTLIDTARGYGLSEERIGRHLAHRRGEFALSTKVGYGIEGYRDWTPEIIEAGIDRALRVMKTDVIDIVHLHSCPIETLQVGAVVAALAAEREKGKIRVAAYSGENEELGWAIQDGRFQSVQTSANVCDQFSMNRWIPAAAAKGLGVIAKRPMANAFWLYAKRPVGEYVEDYWARWKEMALRNHGLEWSELAIRFAAYTPGVCSCIVGTKNLANLGKNIDAVKRGPLPGHIVDEFKQAFAKHGAKWPGLI